jgi:hypothetical protein
MRVVNIPPLAYLLQRAKRTAVEHWKAKVPLREIRNQLPKKEFDCCQDLPSQLMNKPTMDRQGAYNFMKNVFSSVFMSFSVVLLLTTHFHQPCKSLQIFAQKMPCLPVLCTFAWLTGRRRSKV